MYLDASGLSKAREAAFSFLLHSLRGCVEERRAEKGVKWNSPISPPEFLQSLAGNFSTEGKFAVEPTQTLERPPKRCSWVKGIFYYKKLGDVVFYREEFHTVVLRDEMVFFVRLCYLCFFSVWFSFCNDLHVSSSWRVGGNVFILYL